MMPTSSMNRREFLKRMGVLGGGIIIYFNAFDRLAWARKLRTGFLGAGIPTDFNAFLRIGADNRIVLYTGKIEMGQGAMTSIPQLLAEELYVNYDSVDIVMGDTDLCPWDAGTYVAAGEGFAQFAGAVVYGALCIIVVIHHEVPKSTAFCD